MTLGISTGRNEQGGRLAYLSLRHKNGQVVSGPGSKSEIRHALNPQFVPDGLEVVAVVELDLVCDEAGAILFVCCVLQVPAILRLLHKLAERLLSRLISGRLDGAPDLEILGGIASLVLGGSFPSSNEGAPGRKAQLIDGGQGKRSQDLAG